jgi:hypothetical protein
VLDPEGPGEQAVVGGQANLLVGFAARRRGGGFGQAVGFAAGEGGLAGV